MPSYVFSDSQIRSNSAFDAKVVRGFLLAGFTRNWLHFFLIDNHNSATRLAAQPCNSAHECDDFHDCGHQQFPRCGAGHNEAALAGTLGSLSHASHGTHGMACDYFRFRYYSRSTARSFAPFLFSWMRLIYRFQKVDFFWKIFISDPHRCDAGHSAIRNQFESCTGWKK